MSDDLSALERELSREGTKPVYLVQGEERLLVDEAVKRILAAAVDDPTDPMAVTRVDLAESGTGGREILGACRSLGLFATRQVVVVRAAELLEKRSADRQLVEAYVPEADAATTLILVATKIKGTLALPKRVKKHGRVLTFDALKPWKVPDWVMDEARRLGHRIESPTAKLVAELVGTSLQQLRQVMEQLSLYVGPGAEITREATESLLAATRTHSVFELVDAVGERRVAAALRHLHGMLEHREPPLRIMAMLFRHFRQLWQVAEAKAHGVERGAVQKRLRLHDFVLKKLWAQANRFDEPTLRRAYDLLYRAEAGLKSKGLEDAMIMERLVLDLCG